MTAAEPGAATPLATVEQARRRLNLALALDLASHWLAWWLYVVAVAVVVLKVTGYHEVFLPIWLGLTAFGLVPGFAVAMRRRGVTTLQAAAWVDLKACAGGSVLAAVERPGVAVRAAGRPERGVPTIAWTPVVSGLALPAVFLVAAGLVPGVPYQPLESAAAIRRRAAQVERRIDRAADLNVLDEEEALALAESVRQVADEADRSPEAAAEGVDTLQAKLDQRILEEAEKRLNALQAAADLAAVAAREPPNPKEVRDALKEALQASQAGDLPEDAQKALKELLQKLGENADPNALGSLPESAFAGLDPQQLRDLAEALRKAQSGKLGKAGACKNLMSSAEAQRRLAEMMKGVGKLSELGDPTQLPGMADAGQGPGGKKKGTGPGRGDVTRGRGDADMAFGDETDESGTRFRSRAVRPGESFLPGVTLSRSKRRPEEIAPEEFRPPARTGAQAGETVRGRRAATPLGPYRRGVAARYFSGDGSEAPAGND